MLTQAGDLTILIEALVVEPINTRLAAIALTNICVFLGVYFRVYLIRRSNAELHLISVPSGTLVGVYAVRRSLSLQGLVADYGVTVPRRINSAGTSRMRSAVQQALNTRLRVLAA